MKSLHEVELFLGSIHSAEPTEEMFWSCQSVLRDWKREAVAQGAQDRAKHIWCLEQTLEAHIEFQTAFRELKGENFYSSWCRLERVEIMLHSLSRHFQWGWCAYHLDFLEHYTGQWQSLFPYRIFSSSEFIYEIIRCSICKGRITPRNPCGHRVGEIYDGEMCCRIIEKCKLIGVSLVENPANKYGVAFLKEPESEEACDHYDYSVVEYVATALESPYDNWSYLKTKKPFPRGVFDYVGSNDHCPCQSGRLFTECCADSEQVIVPHIEFLFPRPPPPSVPRLKLPGRSFGQHGPERHRRPLPPQADRAEPSGWRV